MHTVRDFIRSRAHSMRFSFLPLAFAMLLSAPAYAVDIDGKLMAGEWDDATHVTQFVGVQPETLQPSKYRTEAWYKATPKGLAVAFRNYQPAEVPRTRQRARRDEGGQVDRNNVFVDFDGNGVQAYEFTVSISDGISDGVITNENQFNDDWDADFLHGSSESDDYWETEFLIPWHVAVMKKGHNGKRTIGLYLDRVIGKTGERFAAPGLTYERAPYVSRFTKVEVDNYEQQLIAVTPYATAVYDNVGRRDAYKAGADLYWKPNGQFQVSATVNPDFGQVESDGIVINFSANETFYGDKRPFFTENQGIFDFGMLNDNSQLFYTRRVGSRADDGLGPAEIDAAAKVNGSLGKLSYGLFAAQERGDGGRTFQAARALYAMPSQTWGAMLTHVDRPFRDREAYVFGIDHKWKPSSTVTINSNAVMSDIDRAGLNKQGYAATSYLTWNPDKRWSHQLLGMYFDRHFDPNDMGYLSRNNMAYGHVQTRRTWSDLPKSLPIASHSLTARLFEIQNMDGERLNAGLRLQESGSLRDGGGFYAQLEQVLARHDDRLTRGNHALQLPSRTSFNAELNGGKHNNWQLNGGFMVAGDGLLGNDGLYRAGWAGAKYYFNDRINWSVYSQVDMSPDAHIWSEGNLVGRFRMRTASLGSTFNWDLSPKSDLRIKLETVGLSAKAWQQMEVLSDGGYRVMPNLPDSFRLNQLGFQLRYRYELAPLSNLYVVYGRGGFSQFADSRGDDWSMLRDSASLRNDEQLIVKISYRFTN